ncbi:archaeal heat shock protein Hsp14 [Halobium salinum]|uniref:Archaeal heat shock protein Hsp14 n=1 Tax=Halobium salinum TaxID=1364940 RepID=A0ABD5PB39_9EURY|nr:archaeal heat shock protein Hsp14 [Halobium salinum]
MRRHNPFEDFEQMFERMSHQFEDMSRQWETPSIAASRSGGMEIDVADYDDEIVVTADVPGFEKEDIDLTLSERTLTISAEREMERESEEGEYLRRERRSSSMRRSIRLPESIDEERTAATYQNGVLTVTLPKLTMEEGDDARHIDIN